ncbi:phytanoyl-CoA dioxygenase 1-like [Elysia marginata]|uniref:Phytanoyl-CoA dioxygenase 1-like n=1 Tax=Elysia marginata TaxID=1093978 RepID=A0AAV4HYP5_9GAST|nr:phytanoyl-CoA dioxygenase 1-like [Elysia marginata]
MSAADRKRFPGEVDTGYPDPFTVAPPDVTDRKPGQLPREQILKFFDEGYIVVSDYFRREELDPCREDIDLMVDQLAQKLYSAGKISGTCD